MAQNDILSLQKELKTLLLSEGVSDVGFSYLGNADTGELQNAVSIVVKLSDAIIDEITLEPTPTYFNHYRTVNAFIDRCLLKAGLFLESKGYKYITVAASQSMPGTPFNGRFSHKEAARKAGLGVIGKNSLFLHKEYGARVRLGTIITDCPVERDCEIVNDICKGCNLCVKACPSGAILGADWHEGVKREEIFSPQICSDYMKKAYHHIGRGVVCGICMKVCPVGK